MEMCPGFSVRRGAITAVSMRLWRTKRNCFAPGMTFCEDWMCGHLWGIVRIYTIFSSSASDEDFFGILPLRLHDAVNGNGGFCSRVAIISVSRKQIGVVLLTASCMSSPKDILEHYHRASTSTGKVACPLGYFLPGDGTAPGCSSTRICA